MNMIFSKLTSSLDKRFTKIDSELKLQRLMLTLVLGGIIALVLKTFFT